MHHVVKSLSRELKKAKDTEAKDHELHCWIHDSKFLQRTPFTCNCNQKEIYQKNFHNLRLD